MPLYEYQCRSCDHKFETMQSISIRAEETSCPHCHEHNATRLMSAFASLIKGTHKTGFNEMKAYDMYNERMDNFSKLPPIMGQRAAPSEANMGPPADGGSGEA